VRGRRLRTLHAARSTFVALPIDEAVASAFAVYTQDGDFDELAVDVVRV
jgi:hypothetical protein